MRPGDDLDPVGEGARAGAVRLRGSATIEDFQYELALGLSTPTETVLSTDPLVKEERIRLDGGVLVGRGAGEGGR